MVFTHHNCWVEAETQTEGPKPVLEDSYIQTDLSMTELSTQTLSCREPQNLEVSLKPEGRSQCHGCKCASWTHFLSKFPC